jgi:hypothetical protein
VWLATTAEPLLFVTAPEVPRHCVTALHGWHEHVELLKQLQTTHKTPRHGRQLQAQQQQQQQQQQQRRNRPPASGPTTLHSLATNCPQHAAQIKHPAM